MPRSYLHTVREVHFQIEGLGWLDVTGFSMTLQPGSVPMATVGVALAGGGVSATKTNRATINPLSLGSVNDNFNKILALSEKVTLCNFRMLMDTTRLTDGKTGEQSIDLKGWVLVAAGLGSVTTVSGFSCACTIAHPAYLLAMHGGFATNLNERLGYERLASRVKDPISAGRLIYGRVSDCKSELKILDDGSEIKPGGKSVLSIMKEVGSVFKDIPDLIDRYVEWDPSVGAGSNGIPFSGKLTGKLSTATKMVMLESWLPIGAYSVWDILVTIILAEFDLTIIPDYTRERLKVGPFYPWMSPSMELNEDDLFELSFPGTDPSPIYGVCASPRMQEGTFKAPSSYSGQKAENATDQGSVLAYVPKEGADINGKFFSTSMPEWLCTAVMLAPGLNSQDVASGSYSGKPGAAPSSGNSKEIEVSNSLKMSCLAQEFLKEYKKRLEATVNCPLLFSRNGEDPFLPGKVLSVRNENGELLSGYVVEITHTVDTVNGTGTTGMHLAYCRPPGGYDVLKDVMDKNPMYS